MNHGPYIIRTIFNKEQDDNNEDEDDDNNNNHNKHSNKVRLTEGPLSDVVGFTGSNSCSHRLSFRVPSVRGLKIQPLIYLP